MGSLDSAMGKVASSVLGALGGTGTYIQPGSGGSYNPDTGNIEGAGSEANTTVPVGPGPAAISLFEESMIETGDRTAIVPRTDLGFEPNPGQDKLTWHGETWRVVGVEPYGSGDEDAAYALLIRR